MIRALINFFAFGLIMAVAIAEQLIITEKMSFFGWFYGLIDLNNAFNEGLYGWVEELPLPFKPEDPYSDHEVAALSALSVLILPYLNVISDYKNSKSAFTRNYWSIAISFMTIVFFIMLFTWYYIDVPQEQPDYYLFLLIFFLGFMAMQVPKYYIPAIFGGIFYLGLALYTGAAKTL